MAMAAAATACCSAASASLREDSQFEDRQWPAFAGTRSSKRTGSGRSRGLCIVARFGGRGGYMGGGGRGGGRGYRGRKGGGRESMVDDGVMINEQIRAPLLRLIGEDQQMIGVVPREEAFRRAAGLELDLVIIAAEADPPVAKIMDYSKYKYEQQKKKRDQQKKAAASRVEIKELKMRYNIDTHDYEVRLKHAQKFLRDGDKVKVVMPFRGREADFKELGQKVLKRFEADIGELGVLENKTEEGKTMFMTISPSPKAQSAKPATEKPKAQEEESAEEVQEEEEEEEEVPAAVS